MKTKVKKSSPSEASLLKALDVLEKAASIPAEMKDADGGFATEGDGDELQVSASEGEPKVKKARKAIDDESSEGPEMSADDDESEASAEESDEASAPPMQLKKKKMVSKAEETPNEEHSAAETSSPKLTKKSQSSIKKSLMEDEGNRELVEASSFLESLVDQTSDSVVALAKSLEQTRTDQNSFNSKMAKAMIALGSLTQEQGQEIRKLRKALANTPYIPQHRTALSKSEIEEREFTGNRDNDSLSDSAFHKALNQLTELAMRGTVPAAVVTDFELSKSLAALPNDVRAQIQGGLH